MTTFTALRSAVRPSERVRLPDSVAFYLLASIVVFFLASSSAPTPLYSTYASEWGFSSITTTIVFGVYALAVLATLLTAGSLSDHIGRRPVLLAAIAVQAAAMVMFITAAGVTELLAARIVQGLATGAAAGAVGAAMIDINQARGTLANAVATPVGTGLGAIGAGLVVQFLPAPTHLVYVILFGIFALQAVGIALIAETVTPKPGALASLRPEFALPDRARRPFLVAVPALVAAWALAGFYASLSPSLIRSLSNSTSLLLAGLPLFALAGGGAVTIFALRKVAPHRVMFFGTAALGGGVALTLAAVEATSTAGFFVGTVVAGVGFGAAFQGGIRTVVPLAHPHERSGLLSVIYVVSYLALGVPAVLGGLLAVHNGNVLVTAREYGSAVIVLAALAAVGLLRRPVSRANRAGNAVCEST